MINNPGNKFNRLVLVSVISLAFGLSSCGGSSGGDPDPDDSITNVTVGGTVAKGIVKAGVVTAEELNASSEVVATIGSAVTAADGSYSLTLNDNYNGGPIQISITADGNTQTKCDVPDGCGTRTDGLSDLTPPGIDFGEWYKPTALTMTALIPDAESNETLRVSVTPFTHMAAARARAAATLDAAAIANANSEVSNLLGGIDILNTPPVDITDSVAVDDALSKTQVTYAALASALSDQGLTDDNGQPDLNAAIDLLASAFTDGAIAANDDNDGGDEVDVISLQDIVTAANATLTEAGIADLTGVLADLQSDITTAEAGDGTIDPEPSETVADANLDKVKAMVSDVRTWGNLIEAEVGTKGPEFENEINMAADALSALAIDQGPADVLGHAMAAVGQLFNDPNAGSDLTTYITDYTDLGEPITPFTAGTISSTNGVYTITNGLIYGYTVNMTTTFLPADGSSIETFTMGIQSATITSDATSMTVNSGTVTIALASAYIVDYTEIDLGTELPLPKVTDVTFDLDVTLTQSKGVDEFGAPADLASPVTFAGSLAFDLDPVAIKGSVEANQGALPSSFELTGTVSNTSNSMDMSLVMNVTNADTFQFEGDFAAIDTPYSSIVSHPYNMVTWEYTDSNSDSITDTFSFVSPVFSATYIWDSNTGAVTVSEMYSDWPYPYQYTDFGTYTDIEDFFTQQPWLLSQLTYKGYVYVDGEGDYFADLSGETFLSNGSVDGLLTDPEFIVESPGNWIDADIGLTFTVQLTGLPVATVNINANRTAFEAGNGTVTISYGNRQLALSASATTTGVDGVLTITNQDNVVMTLNLAAADTTLLAGDLNYNGIKYGDVEETASGYLKVSYTDGTFEIF